MLAIMPQGLSPLDGFIPFPGALAESEMQTASSRILTLVINSIFYDNNHSTKCTTISSCMHSFQINLKLD